MTAGARVVTENRSSFLTVFRWYWFLLAFLVIPNLPLLLTAHSISLLRGGYIDLDYLLVGLISLFVPRAVTFVLLLVAIVLDFIHAACVTYLFSPAEFVQTMRYGGLLSTTRAGLIVVAFVLAVLVCVVCVRLTSPGLRGRDRGRAFVAVVVPIVILAGIDCASIRATLASSGPADSSARVSRTPAAGLIYGEVIYRRYAMGQRLGGMYAMPSASALAMHHLEDYGSRPALQPNLVLVVVESWGLARDPLLRAAMTEPYSDPALWAKYEVLEGMMPFQGPTTSGEGRELCQSHLGSYVAKGTDTQVERCLPIRLRGLGYRTLAVHGFEGKMYDRVDWYPHLGFQESWFHDRLRAAGLPDCDGPFKGSCDADVAAWLGGRLRERGDGPLFVHWVTLSSHLPLWPLQLKAPRPCGVSPVTNGDMEVCNWYRLISVVSDSMHDLALGPLGRPTIFVITGDHAPPFDKEQERAEFSAKEVPYVILLPKNGTR